MTLNLKHNSNNIDNIKSQIIEVENCFSEKIYEVEECFSEKI